MTVHETSETAEATTAAPPFDRKDFRRVVASSYVGSTIEFYDFLLYATASAVVFGPVFFSNLEPWAGVIAAYGTFAAGYLARPLGGIIFGHFGDRVGRKKLLIISMVLMGVASTLIGLIPTPEVIGGWAAVLLITLRVMQGIAVGGEWGGAALMSLEHAEGKRRGFAASFTNAGAPTGSVLGLIVMGAFAMLPQDQFLAWGWRVPFLISFVLLLVGLYIRSRVSESPVFTAAVTVVPQQAPDAQGTPAAPVADARHRFPLFDVLRRPKALLLVVFACISAFALQVTLSTFAVSYAVAAGNDRSQVMFAFAVAGVISIGTTILTGHLSDRVGRKPLMIAGNVGFLIVLPLVLWLLGSTNIVVVFVGFTIGIVTQTLMYGPMAAFISERFSTTSRYTGASVGYQLATLLGAGLTPTILSSLYAGAGESTIPVVLYLSGLALVSLVTVLFMRESRHNDLATVQH